MLKAGFKTSFTMLSVLFTFACTPADEKHEHAHNHSNEHSQEHTHKHHEHVATSDVIVETSGIKSSPQCITSQNECEIKTDVGTYSVKFAQDNLSDNIITEKPFIIELSQQYSVDNLVNQPKISAYLEGRDMFMGKVPVFFKEKVAGSVFTADTLLADCMEESMVWRLSIVIESTEKNKPADEFFIDFTSQGL